MTEPTPQQRRAIEARGNVLVSAGAGAGKTRTLVDRCLAWILDENERGSVDEVLMVTFTEAAATEMRQRLRLGLAAAFEAAPSLRLQEQLALLETAHISTLHSFCFHLVSQHFFELGLEAPPQVLSSERSRLLASEALDEVLQRVYDGKMEGAAAIESLIQSLGGDWDQPTREIVRRVHEYRHSLREPDEWLDRQRRHFSQEDAKEWQELLEAGLAEWRRRWGAILQARADRNETAAKCAGVLAQLSKKPERAEWAAALDKLGKVQTRRGEGGQRKIIADIFTEAAFLHSLCAKEEGGRDPVEEDWGWARAAMLPLLDLIEAFGRAYATGKRRAGGLDFQDLEQLALRALWRDGHPSPVAEIWRRKFRLVFVDEYQDINAAQEAIIEALGREGDEANRFLVGDVKQSIYRFRLAEPRLFEAQRQRWAREGGAAHALTENFRSHEGLLSLINALFEDLMRPEMGGAAYDETQRLVFGDPANRPHLQVTDGPPRVELHLRHPAPKNELDDAHLDPAECEARLIARRFQEFKTAGTVVHTKEGPRTARWSDMAVLLRAPRDKVESYVKAFGGLGVPLVAARTGFYDTMEARDLLNLLRILDNPQQDLPLLGTLASPFAGLTPRELALVRLGPERGRYWSALTNWREAADKKSAVYFKVNTFLERFGAWRRRARQDGVASLLERALDETRYLAWLGAEDRPDQRRSNAARFLQLARDFDAERGEGLRRFLQLVEAQQQSEIDLEPAAAPATDAVQLMSVHQSKGLEFPIVAVGDLGKAFNFGDARGNVIVDRALGLCPQIRPPGAAQFYPSVAHWLAGRREERETRGEELRLLYVAATRAMEWLILAGTVSEKRMAEAWPALGEALAGVEGAAAGRSWLDWIGGWLSAREEAAPIKLVSHQDQEETLASEAGVQAAPPEDINPEIESRLHWSYPFAEATRQPAKTSVTAVRRALAGEEEEAAPRFATAWRAGTGGAEIGSAHHKFLERASLERLTSASAAAAEAARLRAAGRLSAEEVEHLDFEGVAFFWQSEAGRELLSQKQYLQRELAFTARFAAAELAGESAGAPDLSTAAPPADAEEFVVLQGVADLVAILPREIWIVDFKTDRATPSELPAKVAAYRPQLRLYGEALARAYRRPVTRSWLCFLRERQIVLL